MGKEQTASGLDAALRYADLGWPVFPCKPDKKPYTKHGFKDASCDHKEIDHWWRRWPDAHVGIATEAAGLVVVDLDMKPSEHKDGVAAFSRLCDENGMDGCGLIASTPRGGRHYVYLAPAEMVVHSGADVIPKSGIDVRAAGGYIVAPSPASPGREWVVGDPFDVNADGTTDVCQMPGWVRMLVTRGRDGCAPGNPAGGDSAVDLLLTKAQVDVIREALQFVDSTPRDTWLHVGMALKSTGAGQQAFDLWNEWSQTCPQKFDPKDQAYTWRSLREFRMDGSEIAIGTLFHYAKAAGWECGMDAQVAAECASVPSPLTPPDAPAPTIEHEFPRELMNVPGLVGDVAQWMVESSSRRQHALCLASSLTMFGAILGRRVSSPTDLRTNLYTIGIGETGSGKEVGIKLPCSLLAHAGLSSVIGPGEWKSDSGLRSSLIAAPSHVCFIDEFCKVLRNLSGDNCPPHLTGIKRYLLEMFSRANGVHQAPAYADRKLNAPVEILEPNLCVYGVGVPADLFESMNRGAVSDGFLNRFLVFFVDDQLPPLHKVGRALPPPDLVERIKKLDLRTKPQGLHGRGVGVAVATGCRVVGFTPAADALIDEMQLQNDERIRSMRASANPLADLWNRTTEHIVKVALVASVCDDPDRPMDVPAVEWARKLVLWCTERTQAAAEARVADSKVEADTKRLLRLIDACGDAGMPSARLSRSTQWLRRSDRKDLLQTLIESGQVVTATKATSTKPATVYVAARFAVVA